jgi:DUF971 family protein
MKITAPIRIGRRDENTLTVSWNDATQDHFPVRQLRLACPCAACVNEWTGEKILEDSRVPADVKPVKVFSVGRYAMGIHWSDKHTTGIFAYDYLKKLTLR